MVKVTRNDLHQVGRIMAKYFANDTPRTAATVLQSRILTRTSAGKDADGAVFSPYTDRYKKRKAAMGYPTRPVNLELTGAMKQSLGYRNYGGEHALTVSDEEMPKAVGNQNRRTWIGVNDKDLKPIGIAIINGLTAKL